MARRVEPRPDPPTPAAGDPPAADALSELVPDLPITIAGRAIVIREYGAFEGFEVAAQAAGLMASIVDSAREGEFNWTRMRRLIGQHSDEVLAIAARAADVEPAWVKGLNRDQLDEFLSAWFGVNAGFFAHEVVATLKDELMRKALAKAGTTSSPASPPSASATSTASAG